MTKLRLARSELAKKLSDGPGLYPAYMNASGASSGRMALYMRTTQQCVEVLGAGGDVYQLGSTRVHLRRALEPKRDDLLRCIHEG